MGIGDRLKAVSTELEKLHTDDDDSIEKDMKAMIQQDKPWAQRLWSRTVGVATVYLKKPVLPPLSEYKNLIKRRSNVASEPQYQNERGASGYMNQEATRRQESLGNYDKTGAEVRLLRRLQFFKSSEFEPSMLDFGVGMKLNISQMQLQPVARVRLGNLLTIKALPEPVIKLSHVLPIHFQGMQAHLRYEVPFKAVLGNVDALWKQPARMLIRFEHGSNSGLHFYPGGLEFGDHTIKLGNSGTALRAAAGYSFPRELPYSPEQGGKIELYRLGVKALW